MFSTGAWFKEMCEIFDLSEDNGDYTTVSTVYWRLAVHQMKRKPGLVRPLPLDGDVEMGEIVRGEEESKEEEKEGHSAAEPGGGVNVDEGAAVGSQPINEKTEYESLIPNEPPQSPEKVSETLLPVQSPPTNASDQVVSQTQSPAPGLMDLLAGGTNNNQIAPDPAE